MVHDINDRPDPDSYRDLVMVWSLNIAEKMNG